MLFEMWIFKRNSHISIWNKPSVYGVSPSKKPQDIKPHCHLVAGSNFAVLHFDCSPALDFYLKSEKDVVLGGYPLTSRKMKGAEGQSVGSTELKENVI